MILFKPRAVMGAALAAVLVAAAACSNPPVFGDVSDLAGRFGDAVWHVNSDGCGWRSRGSAFAIDQRHLVTNHHVIANDVGPTVTSRDGRQLQGRVVGATARQDIAVIRVDEDLPLTLGWAPPSELVQEEPVVLLGYPSPSHRFTASIGQIVNFQGQGGLREAALSNAHVERGNSGGPGLRADASVAGVVTLMSLRARTNDRVAVLYTADAVRSTVEDFIRNPREVLSDCGLGPDYVPEVPEEYDISEPPPPPPPDITLTPTPEPASTATPSPTPSPRPTPTPVECPAGRPAVEVTMVSSEAVPGQDGYWSVRVSGNVDNRTSSTIRIRDIHVELDGDPPRSAKGFPEQETLAPGSLTSWEANDFVHSPGARPTRDDVTVALSWAWDDQRFRVCPTA